MRALAFDVFLTVGSGLIVAGAAVLGGLGPALIAAGVAVWAQTIVSAWVAGGGA